jgi:hypothetical protein
MIDVFICGQAANEFFPIIRKIEFEFTIIVEFDRNFIQSRFRNIGDPMSSGKVCMDFKLFM